jgi:hypothetical protein
MLSIQQRIVEGNDEIIRGLKPILQMILCGDLNDHSQFMSDMDSHVNSGGNGEEDAQCETKEDECKSDYENGTEKQVRGTEMKDRQAIMLLLKCVFTFLFCLKVVKNKYFT